MENWFFKRFKSWRDDRAEMARGLDCYDPESRVFPGVAKKIQKGREFTKRDVLLILRWKTPSFKKSYSQTVNDDNMLKINKALRDAGETGRESEALKALDEIPEIGLPVASAILTVCYPRKFTILDIRLLGILSLYPSRLGVTSRPSLLTTSGLQRIIGTSSSPRSSNSVNSGAAHCVLQTGFCGGCPSLMRSMKPSDDRLRSSIVHRSPVG
jgi:hypothetical protein